LVAYATLTLAGHLNASESNSGPRLVGDSAFPFLELPMEIIEIILRYADYRSDQSLMCVSLGLKQRMKSIDAKILLKSHFLRKYHVLQNTHDQQPTSLGAIYWRDNSYDNTCQKVTLTESSSHIPFRILARWNSGKYTKFQIDGVLQDMDENVMVTSEREPNRIGFDSVTGYSWMRCDDNTRKKHEIKKNTTDYNMRQKACIVDSKGADPIIANVSGSTLYLCVGPNIVSTHTLPYQLVKDILCCNYKLFIGTFIWIS
jgi:hypothetical protein